MGRDCCHITPEGADFIGWAHQLTAIHLSHHARNAARAALRTCDAILQITGSGRSAIATSQIGPGPATFLRLAGRLAAFSSWVRLHVEMAIIATNAVDRELDRPATRLDDARSAHTGNAAA